MREMPSIFEFSLWIYLTIIKKKHSFSRARRWFPGKFNRWGCDPNKNNYNRIYLIYGIECYSAALCVLKWRCYVATTIPSHKGKMEFPFQNWLVSRIWGDGGLSLLDTHFHFFLSFAWALNENKPWFWALKINLSRWEKSSRTTALSS